MKNILQNVCAFLLCVILPACTPANLPKTPTSVAVKPTATFTSTATQTPPLSPTATARPSPTPRPLLVWSEAFNQPILLKGFSGIWSPTLNEIVGIKRPDSSDEFMSVGALVLSSAPTFDAVALDTAHEDNIFQNLTWDPDGQKIFYGVSRFPGYLSLDTDYYSSIWSVNRDGTQSQPLFPKNPNGSLQGLQFWGWINTHTLVYAGYSGGSHWYVNAYDLPTSHILFQDTVHVVTNAPIHANYIPIVDCQLFCSTCVLTEDVYLTTIYACRSETTYHAREFPRDAETYPFSIDTIFQDWQPGTDTILISGQGNIENTRVSRLLLWNIDTNKVTSLIPGGLFGKFSPDGKLLAFITSGPFDQYVGSNLHNISFDPIADSVEQYLQMMDIRTRQILLKVPVRTQENSEYDSSTTTEPEELSFSPNGRYLSFLTNGSIALKNSHFPADVVLSDPANVYLNILDLQTKQFVQSLPMDNVEKDVNLSLSWSPNSDQFAYQDRSGNWQLFGLSNNIPIPITQANGDQLESPAWSFDGRYLSFSTPYYLDSEPIITYILAITDSQP